MKAVITQSLSKQYEGGKLAVSSVCLALNQGEVFGFLGPNGAGKTTMVKLLGGTLAPTSGSCQVFGINPAEQPEAVHKIAGVVTEHAQMYDHMTGMENLLFYGAVFNLPPRRGPQPCHRPAGRAGPFRREGSKAGRLLHRHAAKAIPCPRDDSPAQNTLSG